MNVLLDILTGLGVALAVGIRPFLPAIVTGLLAMGDVMVDFDGTDFEFAEEPMFLGALGAALVIAQIMQLFGIDGVGGWFGWVLAACGAGLGALLFAATLADGSDTWWPGLPAGAAAAVLAAVATRTLLIRTGARLDGGAKKALPFYAVAIGMVLAALAVVAPPVSVLALVFFGFLLKNTKRREGEKYAGLRILK